MKNRTASVRHSKPIAAGRENALLRLIQNILFVLGGASTALVAVSGLAFVGCLLILPSGPDAWGAIVVLQILAIGGGILGAIAGLLGSIYFVLQQRTKLWSVGTWIGVAVGLAAGLVLRFLTILQVNIFGNNLLSEVVSWLPMMIVVTAALAFLGGAIGGYAVAFLKK